MINIDNLFNETDKLKAELSKLRPLNPGEIKRLQEDFVINNTYNSNAIEGNTITLNETNLIIRRGVTINGKSIKEHLEIVGYRDALYYIFDLAKEKETHLTESTIKSIHSLVLMNDSENKGTYRKVPVSVGSHTPPPPYLVEEKINKLLEEYNSSVKTNPLKSITQFHLQFEQIHPFIDGNGRTGRLLMNLELIKHGYLPIDIKFSDVGKYYSSFEDYNENSNIIQLAELITHYENEELKKHITMINDIEKSKKRNDIER